MIIFVLEISISGFVPGIKDQDIILTIMLSSLGAGFIILLLTIVAGFAHDIETTK